MYASSSIRSQLTATREQNTLWKDYQDPFNTISRQTTLTNRPYQVQLVDDDNEYFESVSKSVYEKTTIKKVKYARDNWYGHVVHTMATGTIQLATCV